MIAVPLLSSLLAILGQARGWLDAFENLAYDLRLTTFSPTPTRSPDVVLVEIDDATLAKIGSNPQARQDYGAYPYSRNLWAQAVEHLLSRGARAVGFDAVMDERHPDATGDLGLAIKLAEHRAPFYLGFKLLPTTPPLPRVEPVNRRPPDTRPPPEPSGEIGEDLPLEPRPEEIARALAFPVHFDRLEAPRLRGLALDPESQTTVMAPVYPVPPIGPLVPAVAGFGLVAPETDPDGKMRRTRFAYSDGANTYALLSVALAADILGAERLELSPGRLKLGPRELAISAAGDAKLDYGGALTDRFQSVSLWQVLQDYWQAQVGEPLELPEDLFRGKVVLLCGTSLGTYDMKATPFSGSTPGVVKIATEVSALLSGRFITDWPFRHAAILTLALALLSSFVLFSTRSLLVDLGWALAALVALFAGTGLILARAKLHVPLVMPGLAVGLTSLASLAFNGLFARREGQQIKAMFSRYVAPQVVEQLVRQPERLRLDGENLEVTAFFSDIRGFSTFSERFKDDPRGLVALLNTYLTRVSGTLQRHGACLDKYIGDAVVCIFGAPLRMEDHAVRACRAALEVQQEVDRLREEFLARGLPDLYTRIGMNTAVMFVGNFGSEQLFNYTAMGDGMNLASRLEGANKAYSSRIMIGPRTYELAKDFIEARELDRVRVAGKTEAVAVYELLALKGQLPETTARVVALYAQALARYREGRFADALPFLDEALRIDGGDGPSMALRQRCQKYLSEPPAAFDGVVSLDK